MKKVIWIGPIVEVKDENKFTAISPAANKWQLSFIEALQDTNVEIVTLSYLPEPYFPKGQLIPYYEQKISKFRIFHNKYINIPFIRNLSLAYNLINSSRQFKDFDYLITYNNYYPHIKVARFLQSAFHLKWINIVADDVCCKGPDVTAFLSYGYFKEASQKHKYHLDGGIDPSSNSFENETIFSGNKILLFAGTINKWTGIEEFAVDFYKLGHHELENVELHIYGKGDSETITRLAKADKRIKFIGFVEKKELDKAMQNCFAFVNPRPLHIAGGEFNFPSKILTYLTFGKPIISTHTAGIAPYYEEIVFFYDGSIESLLQNLKVTISLAKDDLKDLKLKINLFMEKHSWSNKVSEFIKFIETI